MNATWIITTFVIIDDLMQILEQASDCRAKVKDSEILTIAVVAAKYFDNHHARAVLLLSAQGYLSGKISPSRFNRRLHHLAEWFELALQSLVEVQQRPEVYIIDSLPVPVWRRARASRSRKVPGRIFCGYCAAKRERFFGWRLHLVVTTSGVPVSYSLVPAGLHDLTPLHELAYDLPKGAKLLADKAYNSRKDEASMVAETGVEVVPIRRANMELHTWADRQLLRQYRHRIESVNSQLARMGLQHLYAKTNAGFVIKVRATLLAVFISNAF
jgi:hypothetical protein